MEFIIHTYTCNHKVHGDYEYTWWVSISYFVLNVYVCMAIYIQYLQCMLCRICACILEQIVLDWTEPRSWTHSGCLECRLTVVTIHVCIVQ